MSTGLTWQDRHAVSSSRRGVCGASDASVGEVSGAGMRRYTRFKTFTDSTRRRYGATVEGTKPCTDTCIVVGVMGSSSNTL